MIRSVKLTNFRSHESFVLQCNPQTTTIIGENGCGKTSVLEAIYEHTGEKFSGSRSGDCAARGGVLSGGAGV